MAGTGRKVWGSTTLSSAELQSYLQDQVVMRYPSAAAFAAAVATPTEGMIRTLDDVDRTERYDGAAWRPVSRVAGGKITTTSDANGLVVVGHPLGAVPKWMVITAGKQSTAALDSVMDVKSWDDTTSPWTNTQAYARTYRHDGTNGVSSPFSTAVTFYWAAGLD